MRQTGPHTFLFNTLKYTSIKKARHLDRLFLYRKRDLNPHTFRHTPLKRACLPVPPFRYGLQNYKNKRNCEVTRMNKGEIS
jgi:hypothetical protein